MEEAVMVDMDSSRLIFIVQHMEAVVVLEVVKE